MILKDKSLKGKETEWCRDFILFILTCRITYACFNREFFNDEFFREFV